jgi:hypothetical protein
MAPLIHRRKRRGRQRLLVSANGTFFPGEVVRILGLHGMDYRQLRDLRRLVCRAKETGNGKWARYTFTDLVTLRNAIELAGGLDALKLHRRLRIRSLSRVLQILEEQLGVANPLCEIRLERVGSSVLAHLHGAVLDPMRSQFVFRDIMRGVKSYLRQPPYRGRPKTLKEIKELQPHEKNKGFAIRPGIRIPLQVGSELTHTVALNAERR